MSKPSEPATSSEPGPAAVLPSGREWIAALAVRLGAAEPTEEEFTTLLALAGVAAHASERIAAPVACWLAAKAGVSPSDGLLIAQSMTQAVNDQESNVLGQGRGIPGGS